MHMVMAVTERIGVNISVTYQDKSEQIFTLSISQGSVNLKERGLPQELRNLHKKSNQSTSC